MNKLTKIVLAGLVAVPVVITVVILSTTDVIKNKFKKNDNNGSEGESLVE